MATVAKKPQTRKKPAVKRVAVASTTNTQAQLDSHEKECAIRYASVLDKLKNLDKRMWRLEGYLVFGILAIIASRYLT